MRAFNVWRPELQRPSCRSGGRRSLKGLREVGNGWRLRQVTIEEHQVGDLVFVLLPLYIHIAEGHIDLRLVQYDAT
jgi:hypothetical protein